MKAFKQNIISIYGERGEKWLNELPSIVQQLAQELGLKNFKPVANLTYNYVLKGEQGAKPIILKLSLDCDALAKEVAALSAFAGHGAVPVIYHNQGVLLLERAISGVSLKQMNLPHEQKLEIICDIMSKLHQAKLPVNHNFPSIKDWLQPIYSNWDVPGEYLERARSILSAYDQNIGKPVLLHGDLHHDNILQSGKSWVVIDPKGVIGEAVNEIWPFIIDVEADTAYVSSKLGLDLAYVRNWYFVQVLLAAIWNLEDGLAPDKFLNLAAIAYPLTSLHI